MRRGAGRLQRLDFEGVAIRLVEQMRHVTGEASRLREHLLCCPSRTRGLRPTVSGQQLIKVPGKLGGEFEAAELPGVARLQCELLSFALGPGQRGLEHIGRRGAIAAFALLVEIDRCAMQTANAGWVKRSITLAALTLLRLPDTLSIWSEVVLSAMMLPTLKLPSSS